MIETAVGADVRPLALWGCSPAHMLLGLLASVVERARRLSPGLDASG